MNRREFIKSVFAFAIASQVPVEICREVPLSLLGIPYHQSNATTGTWLGFDRSTYPMWVSHKPANPATYRPLVDLVKLILKEKKNGIQE